MAAALGADVDPLLMAVGTEERCPARPSSKEEEEDAMAGRVVGEEGVREVEEGELEDGLRSYNTHLSDPARYAIITQPEQREFRRKSKCD